MGVLRREPYGTPADIFSYGVLWADALRCLPQEAGEMYQTIADACQASLPAQRPGIVEILSELGVSAQCGASSIGPLSIGWSCCGSEEITPCELRGFSSLGSSEPNQSALADATSSRCSL